MNEIVIRKIGHSTRVIHVICASFFLVTNRVCSCSEPEVETCESRQKLICICKHEMFNGTRQGWHEKNIEKNSARHRIFVPFKHIIGMHLHTWRIIVQYCTRCTHLCCMLHIFIAFKLLSNISTHELWCQMCRVPRWNAWIYWCAFASWI